MKNNLCRFFWALAILLLASPVWAGAGDLKSPPASPAPPPAASPMDHLTLIDSGTVKEILKSDLLLLNNKRYRLDNIRIPVDYDLDAREEMNSAFLNQNVSVYTYHKADEGTDRYGVPLVHVMRDDATWAQAHLVSKGLAWSFSSETSRQTATVLRDIEEKARVAKAGFWANPQYDIKTPTSVKAYIDSYQIVQGKIMSVDEKSNTIFFNFGKDWKKDFTVKILKTDWKEFTPGATTTPSAADWKDHVIRIRGWVELKDGPMIQVTHPEQIEVIQ